MMRYALHALLGVLLAGAPAWAEKTVFRRPELGAHLALWRLTDDPAVRDHANYHNTQCFSPDGRYVAYTHWGGPGPGGAKSTATIHVYDLAEDRDWEADRGVFPRWAKHHNWLFYVSYKPRPDSVARNGSCVMWLDLETGRRRMLVDGPEALGETDCGDRWIYGALRFRGRQPEFEEVRIPLKPGARLERLPGVEGAQRLPNPRHPVFFTRRDHKQDPFQATRYWYDLDGGDKRIAVPTIQQCHMAWLGDGEYLLLGNGLIRGRRWNEPFPSNVHILASVAVGDVSPCGASGRYACGDSMVADLRSGAGWRYNEPLSMICYPRRIPDNSGIYDADPKGSPDGTKICFVSNYPLRDGPVTEIAQAAPSRSDRISVLSTEGFPEAGLLNVHREVIRYGRKTPVSFEQVERAVLDTAPVNLRPGRLVTSFDARCLSDEQWRRLGGMTAAMRQSIEDPDSPLARQRQTDVYIAVVRRPDRPRLRRASNGLEIVPGQNHWETRGYRLLRNGRPMEGDLLAPGASLVLDAPGRYAAAAVEWSGLESEPSPAVALDRPGTVTALKEKPSDFSWTFQRRTAGGVVETVHLEDGVIRREWREAGRLAQRHDLDREGRAIRRVRYVEGRMAQREYYTSEGRRVSRELFDAAGYITETILYRWDPQQGEQEADHWWFEQGVPVKQVRGGRTYVKRGDRFGRYDEQGRWIDTPRGALSE